MPLPFTPNRGNARVVGVCPRQYAVLLLNIGLRTVDRLRREISFVHNIFIFAGVCMRSERAKKNLIKMTRYSYPGGKINIFSLTHSLSRRQPPPPAASAFPVVPTSPILDHSDSAPPCQTHSATHRRATPRTPDAQDPALRSQNGLVSNYPRGLPPP